MVVKTVDKLVSELESGGSATIGAGSFLDVTGVAIPNISGTLKGQDGACIIDRGFDGDCTIEAYHDAEVNGIQFVGPSFHPIEYDQSKEKCALKLHGDTAKVQNCEFYGWTLGGVAIGSSETETDSNVLGNKFMFCWMKGLGYGICHYNGHMDASRNYIDCTRHAISSYGRPSCSYDAHHNTVGEHSISHAFDMHNWQENGGDKDVAGGEVRIWRNEVKFDRGINGKPQEAVKIRGAPEVGAEVWLNVFKHRSRPEGMGDSGSACHQVNVDKLTRFKYHNNFYGGRPPAGIGAN